MAIGFRRTAAALTAGMCLLGAVNIPSVMPTAQVYAADFTENGTADGYYYELWNCDRYQHLRKKLKLSYILPRS